MSTKVVGKVKSIKIFNKEEFQNLLEGVQVASCMLTEPQQTVDEESVMKRINALTLNAIKGSAQCSCCGAGPFENRAQQTAHYKHHWHTHNIKRKLFGKGPLSLSQFTNRQDDNDSVSGSDSDAEESKDSNPNSELFAAATRHCKAFYVNSSGKVFSIYRCLLHHRKENLSKDGNGEAWVKACKNLLTPTKQHLALLMISGGHFAGAIFSEGTAIVHKTFHSYVVRRGQGHAQGARDSQGNAPKSAGSSLRRYNQQQFNLHIQEILKSWSDELSKCSLIFYRAVGPVNQTVVFGDGSPLSKDDQRLRVLPFPTRKPTYKELQRAFSVVTAVELYDSLEQFQNMLMATSSVNMDSQPDRSRKEKKLPQQPINRAKSREPIVRELPTQHLSSEDEGPTFIDSETPENWIKLLEEQSKNGVITNSRIDLINDSSIEVVPSTTTSEGEDEKVLNAGNTKKAKRKIKAKAEDVKTPKKPVPKIPGDIKKMWKVISAGDMSTLETIVESWEGDMGLCEALNVADPADGNTALHKAAIASSPDLVTRILNIGGDPCARNNALQTPYVAASHQDTRIAFRLYQGENPDRHNYAKAHIPGPLTPELLEQERERKAQQKKAKRQRDKEKQVEKQKTNKFLDLTDAEKTKVSEAEGRCFLCGERLPKSAFQYSDYKFCSVKCLQKHRHLRPLNLTT